ncbi:MAG: hypothetical protein HY053_06355 [Proteobacteria bacterium]|nr:hypothetical protein [Pseudomonadota bacterium]
MESAPGSKSKDPTATFSNSTAPPITESPAPPPPPPKKETVKPKPYIPPALLNRPGPESNEILPPLYGWNRLVLHDLKMPESDEVTNNCGMKEDMIFQFFATRLQDAGIPIVSDDQAAHLVPDVVTVEAQPSITSMQDLVINCISYVQFRVKVELTFRVPPMMYRRTVPILLWNDGVMVSSAKSTHNGALINAFIGVAERFKAAWQKQNGAHEATPGEKFLGQ